VCYFLWKENIDIFWYRFILRQFKIVITIVKIMMKKLIDITFIVIFPRLKRCQIILKDNKLFTIRKIFQNIKEGANIKTYQISSFYLWNIPMRVFACIFMMPFPRWWDTPLVMLRSIVFIRAVKTDPNLFFFRII